MASLWLYLVLAVLLVGGVAAGGPLFVLTAPFDRNRRICGHMFRALARMAVACCWLWRFRVDGSRRWPVNGAAVVVSNHESHCDAFLISHLCWEMKWLAKASLFRLPGVGWLMAMAGDVPIHRGQRGSGEAAMARLKDYLARGMPVFLFPEGTRAVSSEMLPFKAGAFRLALEARVPVVPLAVAGTRTALTKHSWKFGRSRALVRVGTPIDVRALARAHGLAAGQASPAAVAALAALARAQVGEMRATLLASLGIAGDTSR